MLTLYELTIIYACYLAVSESDPTSSLASAVPAKVKLQISYNSTDQLLSVMVRHVRNLVSKSAVNCKHQLINNILYHTILYLYNCDTKVALYTILCVPCIHSGVHGDTVYTMYHYELLHVRIHTIYTVYTVYQWHTRDTW